MLKLSLIAACLISSCATPTVERTPTSLQSVTTPFAGMSTQLQITPGQTYLSFMKSQVKPGLDAFETAIKNEEALYPAKYSQWQTDLISQKNGVAVRIDSSNYFFNVGYLTGEASDDIKSGRSYGVGPTNRQSDPSDLAYLTELENYLKSEPDHVSDFYSTIMMVLTNCDTSGWSKLSTTGQIVATDFIAIYTAESDRHLMVNLGLKQHPWEIDLAATTFVSIFDATTGKINKQVVSTPAGGTKTVTSYELDDGGIPLWWAKGFQGSGIGETRSARLNLTQKISSYEQKNHPEVVAAIKIPTKMDASDDAIQDVFEYLNTPNAPLKMSATQSTELTQAVVQFVLRVQKDSMAIATDIIQ